VSLSADDGDDDIFDDTALDGHAFALAFSGETSGPFVAGTPGLYETAGPGSVTLTVTPSNMVNDLQWAPNPDAYQSEVQNPEMTVDVEIIYDYTIVPEPATMSLLALGGLALLRRKRR